MKKIFLIIFALVSLSFTAFAENAKLNVVAAENQYGSVAKLIGGDSVNVTNIINNADGDPHTFISSVKNAKLLANADVIIYNGADYDSWIQPILKSNEKATVIKIQDLAEFKKTSNLGINPHLWYKPETFPALAKKLTEVYSKIDTIKADDSLYQKNLKEFNDKYKTVDSLVEAIKKDYSGTPVTATEPVFGYMEEALGLETKGLDFQWVIMNDSEPSPKMMIAYQDLLKNNEVKVLFYNKQVTDNTTKNILDLANKQGIPVVGVTETMPTDKNAISWMVDTLSETQQALAQSKKSVEETAKND